jgi:zinc protease
MSGPLGWFLRLAAALAALVLVTAPGRAGLFNPETFTLDNGMRVVVIPDHRAPVVTHMVWYKVGAADEPPGKSGIAHFLEHLMFKGTPQVPPGEFSKIVARNGGRDNAFTSHDYTGYVQSVAVDKLELVMQLEADRAANLVLTEAVVAPEREVVLEERRSRTDNEPSAILSEQLSAAQFLAHPYGVPVVGWEHEIRALDKDDALDFYRAHYVPNNAILVVAGDVTAAQVRPLAEKYYGVLAPGQVPPRLRPQEPPQRAARRLEMRDTRVRQPTWRRSYLAPSRMAGERQHSLPLRALAEILGGGPTSRLYRALVVEQKVAAGASAFYSGRNIDRTRFWLAATPMPGGDIAAVETAAEAIIDQVVAEGVNEEELARVKTGMLAAAVYARDSISTAARIFGTALAIGLSVEDVENWPQRVEALTVEKVNAAARYVFDDERSVTGILLPEPAS